MAPVLNAYNSFTLKRWLKALFNMIITGSTKIALLFHTYMYMYSVYTVEPPLKETLNKGNLSIMNLSQKLCYSEVPLYWYVVVYVCRTRLCLLTR